MGGRGVAAAEEVPAIGAIVLLAECRALFITAVCGNPGSLIVFGSNVGSNTGRSGLRVVARVRSVTSKPGGRLEKYFCL